jgi:hypothetical protein
LPRLPKGSEIARILKDHRGLNLLTVGETLFLRVVFPSEFEMNATAFHQLLLKEVVLPAFRVSTNNSTLTPNWIYSREVFHIDGPVAYRFLSAVEDNLKLSFFFCSFT